jgi:hypothetical protein
MITIIVNDNRPTAAAASFASFESLFHSENLHFKLNAKVISLHQPMPHYLCMERRYATAAASQQKVNGIHLQVINMSN